MKRKVPEKVVLTEEGWSLIRGSLVVQGGSHSVHMIHAVTVPQTGFYLHISFHVEYISSSKPRTRYLYLSVSEKESG